MARSRCVAWICAGIFLVSLANGAMTYLKRVGVIEHETYQAYMSDFCAPAVGAADGAARPCSCRRDITAGPRPVAEPPDNSYLFQDTGAARWLKLAKDFLFVAFAALSVHLVRSRREPGPSWASAAPTLPLVAAVGMGFVVSATLWGGVFAIVGLRSFEFLAVAWLGGWAAGDLRTVTRWTGALLLVETALVAIELMWGMPLRECPQSFRAAGTLVMPNTLGVVTAVALGLGMSFAPAKGGGPGWVLVAAAAALVAASGSGTGLVALFVVAALALWTRLSGPAKALAGAVLLLLALAVTLLLPALTQRPDLYDSLFGSDGRVGKLLVLLRSSSAMQIAIGRGVGFGTNTSASIDLELADPGPVLPGAGDDLFSADSTVIVLLTQLGAVGIAAFYGLLGWAFRRDPVARPAYLVMLIASLTINITEVFPANFLLGLLLARSMTLAARERPAALRP